MLIIKPLADYGERELLCEKCQCAHIDNSLIYSIRDGKDIGICQFSLNENGAEIHSLRNTIGTDDIEALIIAGRAALDFIERTAGSTVTLSESNDELALKLGFIKLNGKYTLNLKGYFKSCSKPKKEVIGLYGGSFNPPHLGHVAVAKSFAEQFCPSALYIMPAFISPFKPWMLGAPDQKARLKMAELAFSAIPNAIVSDFELSRGGVSYTYNTVCALKEKHPDSDVYIIIGSDNIESFDKWYKADELAKLCKLAIVSRGEPVETVKMKALMLSQTLGVSAQVFECNYVEVSSTDIRLSGKNKLVPESVAQYIEENGLYRKNMREKILNALCCSEKRRAHTLGTEKAALSIAAAHYSELDPQDVSTAALLHDFTKEYTVEQHLAICEKYSLEVTDDERMAPKLFHAKTGAVLAKELFNVSDDIAQAIRYHTTGKADMTPLQKIIYLADFIEENRSSPDCIDVRNKYFELCSDPNVTDPVERAILYSMDTSIRELIDEGRPVSTATVTARNWLIAKLK